MIARVAESCFWLHRYVERVDNTARLIGVNFAFQLDMPSASVERWRPLLVVAGVEEEFIEQVGEAFMNDAEIVQEYLIWSQVSSVSAWNSLCWARENARTIRETLSLEAWMAINRFWLWMKSPEARRLYDAEPSAFYERVRESCQTFHGVCSDTLLHGEAFEFMRLGMFLERASQTARILDTKYHAVGPTSGDRETTAELAEWIAILRSCSAYEPFFKRVDGPLTGPAVAGFLLLDPAFPRSVMHCLLRAWNFLQLIGGEDAEAPSRESARQLLDLLNKLRACSIDDLLEAGLHNELTEIVDRLADISRAVAEDYFSGGMPDLLAPAEDTSAAPRDGWGSAGDATGHRPAAALSASQAGIGGAAVQAMVGAGTAARGGWDSMAIQPGADSPAGAAHTVSGSATRAEGSDVSWTADSARVLQVTHRTVYTYDSLVRRSSHHFLLRPVDDGRQDLLEYDLVLSVEGERRTYEDVFGNQVVAFRPKYQFTELSIESRALVRVRGTAEPTRVNSLSSVPHPVVWMPWQRMMMLPYLMPPELPESELSELSRFALDFVQRNNGDLVRAFSDMNETIHADFIYEPGSTTVETTPYETFLRRRGVCQDFAYLFIILAQLLNVPARYRVGYIYTGGDYEGQVRSDASHAWAEVYLPQIGWYGFDPANGKATGQVDYVRVATGRHYRDAAPVAGTIFEGGGGERLDASVRVEMAG